MTKAAIFLSTLLLSTLLVVLALPLLMVPNVSAQFDPFDKVCEGAVDGQGNVPSTCQIDGEQNPIAGEEGVILRSVKILSYIVGAAAVIMIIIGGLKFITANGDANSVASARNTVLYALLGVVIFLMSQLIVRFVISKV